MRGEVLVAKEQEYALAARASGLPTWRILLRHLLPNVLLQAIVFSMSDIVLTILAIVTLGYLGLGVPPPTPDWGSMIAEGQQFVFTKWYLTTDPGPGRRGATRASPSRLRRRRHSCAGSGEPPMSAPLLELHDLDVEIPLPHGTLHAVRGVSLTASTPARPSAWSASPGRARASRCARCWTCCRVPARITGGSDPGRRRGRHRAAPAQRRAAACSPTR